MNTKQMFCGIDVHKENYVGHIMNQEGETIIEHTFPSSYVAMEKFIGKIPNHQLTVVIEACGMWRGAYKRLTDIGNKVKFANPKKIHDIAGDVKCDKGNAKILADLARVGYMSEVYVPNEDVLKLRDIARHKAQLVRLRTKV